MEDFAEIYRTYYDQVYHYAWKLCQNEGLAEEITQETFFKVLRKIDTYRGDCKLSAWMCQIAKNTYYNYLKKQNRHAEASLETIPLEEDIERKLVDKEMTLKIHEVLHTLKDPYREVFWMRTFGELSFLEIGKLHEKTESWARVTYHRAKMMIREELV